jgi:hypothetical protein
MVIVLANWRWLCCSLKTTLRHNIPTGTVLLTIYESSVAAQVRTHMQHLAGVEQLFVPTYNNERSPYVHTVITESHAEIYGY